MAQAGTVVAAMLRSAAAAIERDKDRLSELDGVIGDADHGVTMSIGFRAIAAALAELPPEADATAVLDTAAQSFLNAVGASAGPLYATAFMRAAAAMKGRETIDGEAAAAMIAAMADGVVQRGKAQRGEKTMVDAWAPAAIVAKAAKGDARAVFDAAARAAGDGAESTRAMRASKGRAARLGDRSVGHVDPGAASTAVILAAMADAL